MSASLSRRALIGGASVCAMGALAGCRPQLTPVPSALDGVDGTPLLALADLPVGGGQAVRLGDQQVLLTRPSEDELNGFLAVCTHEGCRVDWRDGGLVCPCHYSKFDVATGAPFEGPAEAPLERVPVRVEGEWIVAR